MAEKQSVQVQTKHPDSVRTCIKKTDGLKPLYPVATTQAVLFLCSVFVPFITPVYQLNINYLSHPAGIIFFFSMSMNLFYNSNFWKDNTKAKEPV